MSVSAGTAQAALAYLAQVAGLSAGRVARAARLEIDLEIGGAGAAPAAHLGVSSLTAPGGFACPAPFSGVGP